MHIAATQLFHSASSAGIGAATVKRTWLQREDLICTKGWHFKMVEDGGISLSVHHWKHSLVSTDDETSTMGMILGTISLFGVIITSSVIGFRALSTARKTIQGSTNRQTANAQQLQPLSNQRLQLMPYNGDIQFATNRNRGVNLVNI